MNILFIIHGFLPFSRTGVENYTFTLANSLKNRHNVLVYTARFDPLSEKYSDFSYKIDGISVKGIYHDSIYKQFKNTYYDDLLNEKFERIINEFRPEIVHFQHIMFHSTGYAEILKALNIPSVLTLHDFYYYCPTLGQRLFLGRFNCKNKTPLKCALCYRTSSTNISEIDKKIYQTASKIKIKEKLYKIFPEASIFIKGLRIFKIHPTPEELIIREREMLNFLGRMNAIISPSNYYKDFYQRYTGHTNILHLDYGFNKIKKIPPKKLDRKIFIFGFAGTISYHKGAHLLIELSQRIGERGKIIVWGNDRNDVILSKRLKKIKNIEYRGEFSFNEKEEVYNNIDYLIVPSIWEENSPLVIHESLLYNTPVIASNRGGNIELIKDGKNGFLFDPEDKNSLINLVEKIIRDNIRIETPDKSIVMDIKTHSQKIEKIYQSLI